MKTKVSLFLFIILVFALFVLVLSSCGEREDLTGFEFELLGTQEYAVKAYSGNKTELKVPREYEGLPVVEIAGSAFENNASLISIKIPNTIERIGNEAFRGCLNLTNVEFQENSKLQRMGRYAFWGCEKITDIVLPKSMGGVGFGAFAGCESLTSMTVPFVGESDGFDAENHFGYIFGASGYSNQKDNIPKALKTVCIVGGNRIDDYAFYGCLSIESVVLPDSIEKIGAHAFSNCTQLKRVVLGKHIEMMGEFAFEACQNLQGIVIPSSVETIGCGVFYQCNKMESITVPFIGASLYSTSTNHIGYFFGKSNDNSNANCVPSSLKSIAITGRSTVGYGALSDCAGLLRVEIGAGVTSIVDGAFFGCSNLKEIVVDENNSEYYSEGICLIEVESKTLIWGCANSVIPNDGRVTSIGSYAFAGNKHLTSIEIPNSVTSIDSEAFKGCTSLKSVSLPRGLTNIEYGAFKNCTKLTGILIPGCVTEIDSWAFENCEALSVVLFGENSQLQSIGRGAFSGCESLTSIVLPNGLTSIGERAFGDCTELTRITLGNCVKSIGYEAFDGCAGLTSIVLPNSMTKIEARAFAGCTGLMSIVIPNSITRIAAAAFLGCSNLKSIEMPSSVIYVGENAFYGCTSLTSIAFSDTDGWHCTTNSNDTGGSAVDVTDAETNVRLFLETYENRHWYKK